ncbi:hypothetical protein QR680_005047 [Steinernema hermaphroditum]|uniref:Protein MAK10 homolog n=1 Tax=Steinernema hermaphroditum TaxID=289476 RepID=A0AA39HS35_9BILA|nr:hypothetical protein QR680_005047 [Steinernema hermaphroditum]
MGDHRSRRREHRSSPVFEYSDENSSSRDQIREVEEGTAKNFAFERILAELKVNLHSELKKQVEIKQDKLLNHRDKDFIERRDKIRQEYKGRLEKIQAYKNLRNDQLDRIYIAEKSVLDKQLERNRREAVENIKRAIIEKKKNLLLEEMEANQQVATFITKGTDRMQQVLDGDKDSFIKVFGKGTAVPPNETNRPVVSGLNPTSIEEDLLLVAGAIEVAKEVAEWSVMAALDLDASLAEAMAAVNVNAQNVNNEEEQLAVGEPRKHIDLDQIPTRSLDITDRFERACRDLSVGQLVKASTFNPYEAMSAIEIMDQKMDVGMKKLELDSLSLQRAIETRRVTAESMPRNEMIATMDCTIAALASWLNGQSLDTSLFTNILLQDHTLVKDPSLKAFCKGILEVFQQFRDVITSAATFRDEDFLSHFYADVNLDTTGCVLDLMKEIRRLNKLIETKQKKNKPKDGKVYKSVSQPTELTCVRDRLEFVLEMLNVVRHFIGFESNDLKIETFRPNFTEAYDSCRNCGVLVMLMTETFKRFGLNPKRDQTQEEEEDDFSFEWLPSFNYDLNRRLLPAAFPRKRDLMSRVEGLTYFSKLFNLLLHIPMDQKNIVPDLNRLLEDVRIFSSAKDSCVLSRAFLQIVVIPSEQKVFGNFDMKDVVQEGMRAGVALNYIQDEAAQEQHIEKAIEDFITDASKCFISIIQIFGHNKARRRDMINECLEDLNVLLQEAADVDNVTLTYLMNKADTKNPKDVMDEVMPSLYGFVLHYAFNLIYYHFQLGFDLDLFEVYEYPYIFWYISRIMLQWFNVVDHRCRQLTDTNDKINDQLKKPVPDNTKNGKNKNKKKGKPKNPKPRELTNQEKRDAALRKLNLDYLSLHVEKKRLLNIFSEAILKAVVALQDSKQFYTPDNERHRFVSRMEKFQPIREVRIFTYDVYREFIGSLRPLQHRQLFAEAVVSFKQFVNVEPSNEVIRELVHCCKRNTVVLNVLANDAEFHEREIVYNFTNTDLDIIPVLHIQSQSRS